MTATIHNQIHIENLGQMLTGGGASVAVPKIEVGIDQNQLRLARVCYHTLEAYRQLIGDRLMGDWEECPLWRLNGYLNGVKYALENPNLTPEMEHDHWVAYHFHRGWTRGPERDDAKKISPCMCRWEDLRDSDKLKSILFVNTCRIFARHQDGIAMSEALGEIMANLMKNYRKGADGVIREAIRLYDYFIGKEKGK